jgi:hypothetical protein
VTVAMVVAVASHSSRVGDSLGASSISPYFKGFDLVDATCGGLPCDPVSAVGAMCRSSLLVPNVDSHDVVCVGWCSVPLRC